MEELPVVPKLHKLDPEVAAKIAAGEAVVSPAQALKELVENALDAGAFNIQVIVQDAGLKTLIVIDDGRGIAPSDLPRLCQRHTTSKLTTYDELSSIGTFGFRGEALAAIACCSLSTTIQSMQEKSDSAYRYTWNSSQPSSNEPPALVAGKQGTTITVQDLFINGNLVRREHFSASLPATLSAVEDVMRAYAIANPKVSFSLKRMKEATPLFQTRSSPNGDVEAIIAQIYSAAMRDKLQGLLWNSTTNAQYPFTASIRFSPPTGPWQAKMKKMELFIFVNKRWVQHASLKKALNECYKAVYGNRGAPFVLVSLTLPPDSVDVNVHPNKETVTLMNDRAVVDEVKGKFERELKKNSPAAPPSTLPTSPLGSGSPAKSPSGTGKRSLDKDDSSSSKEVSKKKSTTPTKKSVASSYPSIDAFLKPPLPKPAAAGSGDAVMDDDFVAAGAATVTALDSPLRSAGAATSSVTPTKGAPMSPSLGTSPATKQQRLNLCGNSIGTHSATAKSDGAQPPGIPKNRVPLTPSIAPALPKSVFPPNKAAGEPGNTEQIADELIEVTDGAAPDQQEKKKKKVEEPLSTTKRRFPVSDLRVVRDALLERAREEHPGIRNIVRKGRLVSAVGCQLLIQHEDTVWQLNGEEASGELAEQYVWRKWHKFDTFEFDPPLPLRELCAAGIEVQQLSEAQLGMSREQLIQRNISTLSRWAGMLEEYWQICFKSEQLHALPVIVPGLVPHPSALPLFVLQLANCDFSAEEACFKGVVGALRELYTVRRTHQLLWDHVASSNQAADDDELLEIEPMSPRAALPSTLDSDFRQAIAVDQLFFYWRADGADPLQRAMDAADRKRAHVFAKPYAPNARYYLVQEATQFFTRCFLQTPEKDRHFEDIVRPDSHVKFFIEVSYPKSPMNDNLLETILRALRTEVTALWLNDTSKKGTDDGWIEFDRSTDFAVNRSVYNHKMSFKSVEHLYTFVSRLKAAIEAKKESSETGRLLYIHREVKKKWRSELLFNPETYVAGQALLLPWGRPLSGPAAISQLVPNVGGSPTLSAPDRTIFGRCLACYAVPTPFEYPKESIQARLSPRRQRAAPRAVSVSATSSPDYTLEHSVWPALRAAFYPPRRWEASGAIAAIDTAMP